eukprot:Sspe_Gene.106083::Locus_83279_Transcript_1_1_Confidence_1.000_Length_1278::g.106083::m.106083
MAADAPDVSLDLASLWGAEWLRAIFHVAKYNPEQKLAKLTKRDRPWTVDFFAKVYAQLPLAKTAAEMRELAAADPQKVKSHAASALYRCERDFTDTKQLRMRFFKAEHPYELIFTSASERQRFYELAKALRSSLMWCPSIARAARRDTEQSASPFNVSVSGRCEVPALGGAPSEMQELSGEVKLRVSPSSSERTAFWVTCFDLASSAPPPSFGSALQPKAADFYVVGFTGVPPDLQGTTKLGEMVSRVVGDEYVPLLSTELEAGKRSAAIMVLSHKQKTLRISNTGAWTGNFTRSQTTRSLTMKQRMGLRGKTETAVSDMVAVSFSVNETPLCFVCTKLAVLSDDGGPEGVAVRNDIVKELLTKVEVGPQGAGDVAQRFHHIMVMGGMGYGAAGAVERWENLKDLPKGVDL